MRLGEAAAPLTPRIDDELGNHLGYVEASLNGRDYLMGSDLTAADVQMSFVGEMSRAFGLLASRPNMEAWVQRFHARPAYKRALEKGGPYAIGQ
jgi:glutathione S-transferase